MSLQVVKTLKISEQENELLRARARELGIFDHGLMRAALRLALGLPVASRLERELRELREADELAELERSTAGTTR